MAKRAMPGRQYMKAAEVCQKLGITKRQFEKLLESGQLRAINLATTRKHPPKWHVSFVELAAYEDRKANPPPPVRPVMKWFKD